MADKVQLCCAGEKSHEVEVVLVVDIENFEVVDPFFMVLFVDGSDHSGVPVARHINNFPDNEDIGERGVVFD